MITRQNFLKKNMADCAPPCSADQIEAAMKLLKTAKKPLILSGGGVRYSGAEQMLADFAERCGIPTAETIAGKARFLHNHSAYVGPMGIEGQMRQKPWQKAQMLLLLAQGCRILPPVPGQLLPVMPGL